MTRTTTGLTLAAALGLAVSLGAQTPASQTKSGMDHDRDNIAVTGCLQRDASGSYVLADARIDPSGASSSTTTTAGTTGTSGTGTTTTTTTTAGTTASDMSAMPAATWKLEGSSSDLDKHVGHKVTVSGREVPSSSSTGATTTTTTGTTATGTSTTGTTGTTAITGEDQKRSSSQPEHRLDVKSVKMISASCS
jgi:hypothetical protein